MFVYQRFRRMLTSRQTSRQTSRGISRVTSRVTSRKWAYTDIVRGGCSVLILVDSFVC